MHRATQFHESYFEHPCVVTAELDILKVDIRGRGWHAALRRWWYDWFLLSYGDERCRMYYSSSQSLRIERAKHFRRYRSRIHPLSKFRTMWDILILIVSVGNRLVFHHNTSITFGTLDRTTHIIGVIFEIILLFEPIVYLKSGYIDNEKRKIILNADRSIMEYCSTKLLFHVLSALPLQTIMLLRFGLKNCDLCRGNKFVCVCQFLSLFGLIRVYKTTEYWSRDRKNFKLSYFYKLLRILVLAIVTMLQYSNLYDAMSVWMAIDTQDVKLNSKFHYYMEMRYLLPEQSTILYISLQLMKICQCLFSYGGSNTDIYYIDTVTGLIGFIIANSFKLWAFVEWYTVVHRNSTAGDHFKVHSDMIMNLLYSRKVSDKITSKVQKYFDLAISRANLVTQSNELLQLLPSSLHRELKVSSYYRYLKRIPYFEDWPVEIIEDLVVLLKEEIYLAQDVVAPKLSQGEGLMILNLGVLAVYSSDDIEVGHLIDGDYFGELSLVTDREIRTSHVVSVTASEVLLLYKKDFRRYMRNYPDLFFEIRQTLRDKFYKHPVDTNKTEEAQISFENKTVTEPQPHSRNRFLEPRLSDSSETSLKTSASNTSRPKKWGI